MHQNMIIYWAKIKKKILSGDPIKKIALKRIMKTLIFFDKKIILILKNMFFMETIINLKISILKNKFRHL